MTTKASATDQLAGQPIDGDTSIADQSAGEPIDPRRKRLEDILADLIANPRTVYGLLSVFLMPNHDTEIIPCNNEVISCSAAELLQDRRINGKDLVLCKAKGSKSLPAGSHLQAIGHLPDGVEFPVYVIDHGSSFQTQAAADWLTSECVRPDLQVDTENWQCWREIHRYTGALAILKLIGPLLKVDAPDLYRSLVAQAKSEVHPEVWLQYGYSECE